MKVEQCVMAYGVEQDRLRALMPDGFSSLRPVLRINAEIRDDSDGYVEFNTAVEGRGAKGWMNIGCWTNVPFERVGRKVTFRTEVLIISFEGVGIEGGCPAEKDNDGCFFPDAGMRLRAPEHINEHKEFCNCEFAWLFNENSTHGKSIGKTLPAVPREAKTAYPKQPLTPRNAAGIPCDQVLGTYRVVFERHES